MKKSTSSTIDRLVALLYKKVQNKSVAKAEDVEGLLVALNKNNVPILQFLLGQPDVDQDLVNKILKFNLNANNVDLVLEKALAQKLEPEIVSNIIENITLNSLQDKPSVSKLGQSGITDMCEKYRRLVQSLPVGERENFKGEARLLQRLLTCIANSPTYHFDGVQLAQELMSEKNGTHLYPIVAGFAPRSR